MSVSYHFMYTEMTEYNYIRLHAFDFFELIVGSCSCSGVPSDVIGTTFLEVDTRLSIKEALVVTPFTFNVGEVCSVGSCPSTIPISEYVMNAPVSSSEIPWPLTNSWLHVLYVHLFLVWWKNVSDTSTDSEFLSSL